MSRTPGSSVSAPNPLQIPYPKFADGMPKTTQMEGGCSEPPPLKGLQDISLHHEAWQLQRQLEELESHKIQLQVKGVGSASPCIRGTEGSGARISTRGRSPARVLYGASGATMQVINPRRKRFPSNPNQEGAKKGVSTAGCIWIGLGLPRHRAQRENLNQRPSASQTRDPVDPVDPVVSV